jgi:hypothetical protein
MADLNALIAQGAQFAAPPDPFAQYGKMQQLRVGENQNALAQYQLESAKRTDLQQNALNRAYSDAVDPATGQIDYGKVSKSLAAGGAGSQIPAALKQQAEFKKAQDESTKLQSELLANKLKLLPNAYKMADTPEAYLELHKSIHADPILGPWLNSTGATAEKGFAQIQEAIKTGKFNDLRMGSMQSVDQLLEGLKPVTPLAKLFKERNALLPGDPNIEIYNDAIRKESQFAPRAITNVNVPPQEKAERAERGKLLVTEYSDISKAARLAAKTLPSIDANLSILNKGFSTGFGTETIAAGASVLSALGVPNAEKFATNAQVFQAKATEAVLQKQLEQKGPQTESDAQRIDKIGAQLGKTTAGNKFVLTTAKEQLKRDMEQRNFYDAWWKTNKTYDGAEDAWYSGEGGKSLFDRPALKEYIKTTEAPVANRPSLDSIFKSPPAAGAKGK